MVLDTSWDPARFLMLVPLPGDGMNREYILPPSDVCVHSAQNSGTVITVITFVWMTDMSVGSVPVHVLGFLLNAPLKKVHILQNEK